MTWSIREPSDRVPKPSREAVRALIRTYMPAGFAISEELVDLVILAYQNGRYDEASAETFALSFD